MPTKLSTKKEILQIDSNQLRKPTCEQALGRSHDCVRCVLRPAVRCWTLQPASLRFKAAIYELNLITICAAGWLLVSTPRRR